MTSIELAEKALVILEKSRPQDIYAGRRGVCAYVIRLRKGRVVGFRKESGEVLMEFSNAMSSTAIMLYAIPKDLQERAAKIIDSIP